MLLNHRFKWFLFCLFFVLFFSNLSCQNLKKAKETETKLHTFSGDLRLKTNKLSIFAIKDAASLAKCLCLPNTCSGEQDQVPVKTAV